MKTYGNAKGRAQKAGKQVAKALTLGGIAVLLIGRSVIIGSVRENEPKAASRALMLFGAAGLGMVLLGRLMSRGESGAASAAKVSFD